MYANDEQCYYVSEKMNKKLKMIDLQLKKARLDRWNANGTIIHHDSEQIASDRNSMIES